MTTRGFGVEQVRTTAHLIADVLEAPNDAAHIAAVRHRVADLVDPFPVYGDLVLQP
jgi:glycine hydroxymethyltransferase